MLQLRCRLHRKCCWTLLQEAAIPWGRTTTMCLMICRGVCNCICKIQRTNQQQRAHTELIWSSYESVFFKKHFTIWHSGECNYRYLFFVTFIFGIFGKHWWCFYQHVRKYQWPLWRHKYLIARGACCNWFFFKAEQAKYLFITGESIDLL